MTAWDKCVGTGSADAVSERDLSIWVGVDASIKHDSTAIVAVDWDEKARRVRLRRIMSFSPTEEQPSDFESAVEGTLLSLHKRFGSAKCVLTLGKCSQAARTAYPCWPAHRGISASRQRT